MPSTVGDLIEETRRHLYGAYRSEYNQLRFDFNNAESTITMVYDLQGITRGTYITVSDEIMYVWSVDTASKTAVVQRAMLGSPLSNHLAGDLVEVNARFPKPMIRLALQQEIQSWRSDLFAVGSATLTVGEKSSQAVDLDIGDFHYILDVMKEPRSTETTWPRVSYFRVLRNMPTTSFASGTALQIQESIVDRTKLRVVYAKPFTVSTFTDATTMDTIGLADTQEDIPPLGAAWRLLAPREIQRTDPRAQGVSAEREAHPAGHSVQAATAIKILRDERIQQEVMRLLHKYPIRQG